MRRSKQAAVLSATGIRNRGKHVLVYLLQFLYSKYQNIKIIELEVLQWVIT